ncbi:MAG: 23S rRNA (pseudouridine(1915)-N(3))-methyltransferase RlmH [Candidatus Kapabacteria bacterium]|nr:23S rRNA (pseudouridine(1915)-N(3))-methyltransferase RlmH [Candidatus Kapabacteria bacterium]
MKIKLFATGKISAKYLNDGIGIYLNRLKHYTNIEIIEFGEVKVKNILEIKNLESKKIIDKVNFGKEDLILLDEKGKELNSIQFSDFLQKKMNNSKDLVFVIGGAYGFSDEIKEKALLQIALSKMTFSHQMIRLFFLEQLYRGFTILKGEPYHNE